MTSSCRAWLFSLLIASLFIIPRLSPAEINLTSKTYLKFYRDARDNNYTPLFEYLELEGRDHDRGRWDFALASWLGHDFETQSDEDKTREELSYAFVRYSPFQDRRLLLTAGRQYVFEGVAAERIDGVSARWEPSPNGGVALFGGVPTAVDFDSRGGDAASGGRAYLRVPSKAEVGLSLIYETNDTARFREDAGVDIWFMPLRAVEVKGHSYYNTLTDGWGEHAYTLRAFPVKKLILSGLYSRSDYDNIFATSALNAFSPEFLGPHETLTKRGGFAEYRISDSITGVLDYTDYSYRNMGNADYYGARIATTVSGISGGAAFHRMEGSEERLRYFEYRLYAAVDSERWRLSFDALQHHYDLPVNGIDDAYSLNGTLRCAISDSLTSSISADYGKTSDFDHNTMVLLNLVYNFNSGR